MARDSDRSVSGLSHYDRANPAAHIEVACDPHPPRLARRRQFIQNAIDNRLVENSFVPEREVVQLERLQLDARLTRHVLHLNRREVRLTRLGADARELGANVLDRVRAHWRRVGKGLDLGH